MTWTSQSFDKKGRKKWEPVKHGMGDIMIPAEVQEYIDHGDVEYFIEPGIDIIEQFTMLEESNLFHINQKQDIEQSIESSKQR